MASSMVTCPPTHLVFYSITVNRTPVTSVQRKTVGRFHVSRLFISSFNSYSLHPSIIIIYTNRVYIQKERNDCCNGRRREINSRRDIAVTNIIKPITLHRERECVGRYSFCSACSGDTLHVDFVHSIHEMSTLLNGTNNCPFQSW